MKMIVIYYGLCTNYNLARSIVKMQSHSIKLIHQTVAHAMHAWN